MNSLLVRTPEPIDGESIFGYVLRVSESNGYETPWHVLRHAGYSQGEMLKASFTVEKLAEVLGKTPAALARLAYRVAGDEVAYQVNGQWLGRGLSNSPLRLRTPVICPDCVREDGFARAAWDVTAVVACPRHRRFLVATCHACGAGLSWFRPGLLVCRCGAGLGEVAQLEASKPVAALMHVLMRKIEGIVDAEAVDVCGLPVDHLKSVSLAGMLGLLWALQVSEPSAADQDSTASAQAVADALCEWPQGFHSYLRRVNQAGRSEAGQTIGLCKRFKPIYERLLATQRKDKSAGFMRDELVRFGLKEWGEGFVDVKALRGVTEDARFVSASGFAASIGARPITVSRWVKKGLLPATTVVVNGQRRLIADLDMSDRVVRRMEDRVQDREAGRILGMPFEVLRELKRTGHYSTSVIANAMGGYWPKDLEALNARLVALAKDKAQPSAVPPDECVSLERILGYWKLGGRRVKGRFVAAMLDGAIVPAGGDGRTWQGLILLMVDVEAFRVRNAFDSGHPVVSDSAAASFLGVDDTVAAALASAGHLRRAARTAGLAGVTRESVLAFAAQWRALCALAQRAETSSKALVARAQLLGIDLLWVMTPYETRAPFCSSADEAKLLGENLPFTKLLPSVRQADYHASVMAGSSPTH